MRRWLASCAAAVLALGAGAATAGTQSLTILHDNDIHGHLRSFCYIEVAKGPDEHCDVGGAARRATLVKKLRAEGKVGAGETVVLLLTGHTLKDADYTIDFHRGTLLEPEEAAPVKQELAALSRNAIEVDGTPEAVLSALEKIQSGRV